jgi:hypothetical protein
MNRRQLEHAIRAACEVSGDSEIWIFGSQAILGQFPDAPEDLRASIEVDVQPKNRSDNMEPIEAFLGELSHFHHTHGFYVHSLPIEKAAVLPQGWERRTIKVFDRELTNGKTGWCVEAHDLAASKLVAYREKDRNFARVLLSEGMIDPQILVARIDLMKIGEDLRERLLQWIQKTCEEL